MRNILDLWPHKEWTPREGQKEILLEAADTSSWDVLVIIAPTASGKSAIGMTLLKWLKDAAFITPSNILVHQFTATYPYVATVAPKSTYKCKKAEVSCGTMKSKYKGYCKGCHYTAALRKIRAFPYVALTYHMYMAQKLRRSNLVIDEAHNLLRVIQDLEAKKVWRHEYKWPANLKIIGDLRKWVSTLSDVDDEKLDILRAELSSIADTKYILHKTVDRWRGEYRDVIKLLPIDISEAKPHIWPKAKKIVLMSATINPTDIRELGLHKRRVKYLEIPSPISPERRPIYINLLGSFSYKAGEKNYPKLVSLIKEKMTQFPHSKGLVHVTYSMAVALRKYFNDPRIMFHTSDNREYVYQQWLKSDPSEGKVLMACGMQEGLDLLHDLGRWQIIAKIPWPSLGDPAIAYKAKQRPDWYQWEALRLVAQAAGRICRSPEDWGETTITDSSFHYIDPKLFPAYFKEALQWST